MSTDSSVVIGAVSGTKINADFQNISSYINADVGAIVTPRLRHLPLLGVRFAREDMFDDQNPAGDGSSDDLNVPLLLPLTMGVEFEQTSRQDSSTRSISVNIDPLSILLGSQDLQLVKSVIQKWSSKAKRGRSLLQDTHYDAVFRSDRLGLGLRKDGGVIYVDSVKEPASTEGVKVGDSVFAINDALVTNDASISLSSIVAQMAEADRPLKVTFCRLEDVDEAAVEELQNQTSQKASDFNADITFSSAILTLVEKDFPLARGEVVNAKLSCGVSQTRATTLSLAVSSAIGLKCYNLSIWGWEPVLEQGKIAFSADYQDPEAGSRQLTFVFSDGQGGLAANLSDAAVETASKVIEWGKLSKAGDGQIENGLSTTNGVQEDKVSVSQNAANAALLYARRRKHGSSRPFVFQNRTGLSVAFVQQRSTGKGSLNLDSSPFLAVGEYSGLEGYDSSLITEVANGAEAKFRVDVADDLQGERTPYRGFSSLNVSLQTIGGIAVEPLLNLQIHRPGETLLPLRFHKIAESAQSLSHSRVVYGKLLASWRIQQVDEKTILTLGSSLRILSLLREPIEIGVCVFLPGENVSADAKTLKPIGTAYPGQPFFLPLWLAMQECPWCCAFKFDSHHKFSPLFYYSQQGSYDFGPLSGCTVGCLPRRGVLPTTWLATALVEQEKTLTLTLDSLLSLRNLLPVDVEWEVTDRSLTPIDGSTMRSKESFCTDACLLKSGEKVEVLARTADGMVFRFRNKGGPTWSSWVSISLVPDPKDAGSAKKTNDDSSGQQDVSTVRYAQLADSFGVQQNMGVRVSQKDCGFDVSLFAELWCTNCSELDVAFGFARDDELLQLKTPQGSDVTAELTPAEAALREISSLFESGQDNRGNKNEVKKVSSSDVVRLPFQTSPNLVEECFEYSEVLVNSTIRRWWAAENPLHKCVDLTTTDVSGDGWYWIDSSWVRAGTSFD